jgi:hypothetical protein
MALSEAYYEAVERRIEWLTLALGATGSSAFGLRWGWRAGVGFALGSVLSWLNFRWLQQGVSALLRAAATPSHSGPEPVSRWIYARFFARMALLVGAAYVILKGAWFPGRAVLAGLFSLIAAVIVEVTFEVVAGFPEPRVRE